MTKKDVFRIILKLFGLYSIILIISELPALIGYFYFDQLHEDFWIHLCIILVSITFMLILLFKPDIFVNLFKLDKGFDNDLVSPSLVNGNGITKIAMTIFAFYLIVNNISDFLTQLVFWFKSSVSRNSLESLLESMSPMPVNHQLLISSSVNLIIGFLLLTNRSRIAKWVDKINAKNE